MSKDQRKYKKAKNPIIIILYLVAVIAMVICIAFFVYRSRVRQAAYEEEVRLVSLSETDMVISNVFEETETETETESETETEKITELVVETEPETEVGAQSESETATESESETEVQAVAGAPVIKLTATSATIQTGASFDATSYVDEITDDIDNVYTLWRRIQVEGSYDTGTAGTYELYFYVTDTSGYTSNRVKFTLIVQDEAESNEATGAEH